MEAAESGPVRQCRPGLIYLETCRSRSLDPKPSCHITDRPPLKGARRLRLDPDNVEVSESGAGSTETAGRVRVGEGRVGDRPQDFWVRRYFRLETVC